MRSLVWATLGGICFAVAIGLTWTIAHVTTALSASSDDRLETDASGWYGVAVVSGGDASMPAQLNYDYTLQDDLAVLSFDLPAGVTQIVVGSLDIFCWEVLPDGARGEDLWTMDAGTYRHLKIPAALVPTGGRVTCNLPPRIRTASFTTTATVFYNDPRPDLTSTGGGVFLPIELSLNNRDGPYDIAASNKAILGDAILLRPGGNVTVRFHSMQMGEVRDWYILVIGVLVGFGAAMIIEAFRPLIERIGR
ncbi:hypothetical protein [Devosia insulae]|uniref:hypothetical protein n=1 Tax=Devosia insulae TaxID=408174 RepID=UPI00159F0E0E|nr:hypothetical protein [Devosia insulae]